MSIKDADEKLAARQALIQPDGAMTKKLKVAEKLIAAVKTEYYCGDQPTLADYHLYTWLSFVRSGYGASACQIACASHITQGLHEMTSYHTLLFWRICSCNHRYVTRPHRSCLGFGVNSVRCVQVPGRSQ